MTTGFVKFYNEGKGFGFIISDETGDDIYVAASALAQKVREKDRVQYELERGKKGPSAVKVTLI